jgi:hypothetical protein
MKGQLTSSDTHLDFPTHHLLILLNRTLKILLQRPEIPDIPSETTRLPTILNRNNVQRKSVEQPDPRSAILQVLPKGIQIASKRTYHP